MRKLFLLCLMAIMSVAAHAADADTLSLRTLFREMPDSILPYLSRNNRLDMIDFMDSNMKAEVTNNFGGKTLMTHLSDSLLSIQLNEACKVELLLLTAAHDAPDGCRSVLAVLRTVGIENGIRESDEPVFYSVKWNRIEPRPNLVKEDNQRLSARLVKLNIVNYINKMLNKD